MLTARDAILHLLPAIIVIKLYRGEGVPSHSGFTAEGTPRALDI